MDKNLEDLGLVYEAMIAAYYPVVGGLLRLKHAGVDWLRDIADSMVIGIQAIAYDDPPQDVEHLWHCLGELGTGLDPELWKREELLAVLRDIAREAWPDEGEQQSSPD